MNIALIFAGGTGVRMNTSGKPKQFLELNGKPIIIHTLEHFENHSDIDSIAVVCVKDWIDFLQLQLNKFNIKKVKWIVSGGQTGQESIRNGIFKIYENVNDAKNTVVLIHDGVRPLINSQTITDNIESVLAFGTAITISPAIETIIKENSDNYITDIMERSACRFARAPQSFILEDIVNVHKKAIADLKNDAIDSATLMSEYGRKLHTVLGPVENIKITTPTDFYIFRAIYELRENTQILGL